MTKKDTSDLFFIHTFLYYLERTLTLAMIEQPFKKIKHDKYLQYVVSFFLFDFLLRQILAFLMQDCEDSLQLLMINFVKTRQ